MTFSTRDVGHAGSAVYDGIERVGVSFAIALVIQFVPLISRIAFPSSPAIELEHRFSIIIALVICLIPGFLLLRTKPRRLSLRVFGIGALMWLVSLVVAKSLVATLVSLGLIG